jgi:hypothetical protein
LSALEEIRDAGDLDFELVLAATGGDDQNGANNWPEQQMLRLHLPQSEWVAQLNAAKAYAVMLIKVALSITHSSAPRRARDQHLLRAEEHFVAGNYRECVSECRQFLEELAGDKLGQALSLLRSEARNMDKSQREEAILAAIHHYTHLAAHSGSRQGELNYERSDARLILSLAAASAAHRP